jgi:hypothetical protein
MHGLIDWFIKNIPVVEWVGLMDFFRNDKF